MDSSSSEDELLLLAALLDEENQRKRRIWVHDVNLTRKTDGEYATLMPQLREHENRFYKYFRMLPECFDEILNLIRVDISKKHTNWREPICAEERLMIALRFLSTGDSFPTIGHSFRVGFTTVSTIVEEVCEAIWLRMQPIYMPQPTEGIWKNSAKQFYESWQFPNCIGSIDGKHVTIKCPKNTGSEHFCYLKKFSVVLLAIVGADYKFLCVDIGGYGKNSDGGIFEKSAMGIRFQGGNFDVPQSAPLPGETVPTPFVLVGDEAFALKPYLMKPYPQRQVLHNDRLKNYNKRLCRARRVVENAFGILAQKWRMYFRPLELKVETVNKAIQATCVLHNYLITHNKGDLAYFATIEEPESPITALSSLPADPRRGVNISFDIRDTFVNYFNN